jgi:redox-sensing transcriptional repressor
MIVEKRNRAAIATCAAFECSNCPYFLSNQCPGCVGYNQASIKGKGTACEVFSCVREQGLETCEDCLCTPCPFVQEAGEICPARLRFEGSTELGLSLGTLARRLAARADKAVIPSRPERIPEKSLLRASQYADRLERLLGRGKTFVSSFELSQETGVKATLVRKDLSYFGEFGSREGYRISYLLHQLRNVLNLDAEKWSAWVGAERLEADMGLLDSLARHGFRVAAVFDPDRRRVGTTVGAHKVQALNCLPAAARQFRLKDGVLAVPTDVAQRCADALLSAGIDHLLNLSGTWLMAPAPAVLRNCNLLGELCVLSYVRHRLTRP